MLYLEKKNRYLHGIYRIAIHNLTIHKLLNGWLAEFPVILDIFTGYANTTSAPIEVEGGGGEEPQSGGLSVHLN